MSLEKINKIINIINETVYLLIVFSVPLVFTPEEYFGLYQLPKEFILHMGANILLITLSISFIFNPNKLISNLVNNRLIIFSILFVLFSYLISTMFSITTLGSFWGREYGMSSYSFHTFFSLSVISLNIIISNSSSRQTKRLFITICSASTLIALVGLLQNFAPKVFETFTFYHQDRILSTLGNPIYLGSYLLIGNLLSILYFTNYHKVDLKNKSALSIYLFISSIQISALILTLSRGPILSFLIGYMGFLLSYLIFKSRSFINIILLFIAPIIISLVIINLPILEKDEVYFDELVERTGSISKEVELAIDIESGVNILSPNTFNYRGENWIGAIKIIQNWPKVLDNSKSNFGRLLVGYGPDTYVYVYPITVPVQEKIVISSHAHNLFLNLIIENGLIGLSSMLVLFGILIFQLRKKFIGSNDSIKYLTLCFGLIITARILEQMVGLAMINDLLYFYLIIVLIATMITNEKEKEFNINLESLLVKNSMAIIFSACLIVSVIFSIKDYNSAKSGFYFGKGISQVNSGDLDNGILNLEKARSLNKRSEYIQTEIYKVSSKVYYYENQRDSGRAGSLLPVMYSKLSEHEELEPYAYNTQNFITQVTWKMFLRKPELFREEAIARYIRLRNLMPQYLNAQEALANILVSVGEIDLGRQEAELGIKMCEVGGLPCPHSWWVLGETEKFNGYTEKAIKSFELSIFQSNIKIGEDSSYENPAYAFLVLSHQSLALIYEFTDLEKAIFHLSEAQKIAYNSGNVLLLEKRFQ